MNINQKLPNQENGFAQSDTLYSPSDIVRQVITLEHKLELSEGKYAFFSQLTENICVFYYFFLSVQGVQLVDGICNIDIYILWQSL